MPTGGPWWIWFLIPVLFSAPWLGAIIWFWPSKGERHDEPASMAEMARQRLWRH
jgi:4-amino-4-deoxy-L-arabinose transferase-like glycosyltransferase